MDTWNFLDDFNVKVYCISLMNRRDRYFSSTEEFLRVRLLSRVVYYRPDKEVDGRSGCWHSHKRIICANRGRPLLIFEDDVKFSEDWTDQVQFIKGFLADKTLQWDLFRLGGKVLKVLEEGEHVSRAECFYLHAYFVHGDYGSKLAANRQYSPTLYRTVHNDYYHRLNNSRNYILNRQICSQDEELGSDNGLFSRWFRYLVHSNARCNPFHWLLRAYDLYSGKEQSE